MCFGENLPGSSIWKAAQENRGLVQKHSFWEVRDGQSARFVSDAWNQEPVLSYNDDSPLLRSFLQNHSKSKMVEIRDTRNTDRLFRSWKYWNWWQSQSLGEDIEDFIAELHSKRIAKNDDPDKLIWGYTNSGNFNPKEALGLVTWTQNVEPEAKWRKLWTGGWWPKVSIFCWLVIK